MVGGGGKRREGTVKDFGNIMHTLLYLKWITNTHLMYTIWKSAQCYVAAWMGGGFGGEWIHACVAAFLHCSPKTIRTLLIGIPPNKMFLVLKILKLTKKKKVCKQLFWRQQNLTVLRTQTDVPGPWV